MRLAACGALLRTALCCFQALTSVLAGLLLPYPTANLVLDVAMLFLYLGIEIIRLFFGECLSKNISILSEMSWYP